MLEGLHTYMTKYNTARYAHLDARIHLAAAPPALTEKNCEPSWLFSEIAETEAVVGRGAAAADTSHTPKVSRDHTGSRGRERKDTPLMSIPGTFGSVGHVDECAGMRPLGMSSSAQGEDSVWTNRADSLTPVVDSSSDMTPKSRSSRPRGGG